jgi:hypothetical protein
VQVAVPPLWRACGHARGQDMPADSGCGHRMLPVAGGGRGRGHEILLAGEGERRHYPRGFCPLPFLTVTLGTQRKVKLAECTRKKCIRVAVDLSLSLLPFGSRSRSNEKAPKSCKREENQCWRVKINLLRCHPSPSQQSCTRKMH